MNIHVPLITHKESFKASLLGLFALGDWVPVRTPDEITEQNVQESYEKIMCDLT